MNGVSDPIGTDRAALQASPRSDAGVRGWLLVLCLMLTVVGPMISVWIVATEFNGLAPHFVASRGAQWATIISIASTTCSVLYGIYAGLRLWTIKPNAVRIARTSLGFGLVVDVLTTTISTILSTPSSVDSAVFYDVLVNLAASLMFFTICLAYLNKSARVEATYRSD